MTPYDRFLSRRFRNTASSPDAEDRPASQDVEASLRFWPLTDRLFARSDVAFLLIRGEAPQEVASAELGRVYDGLTQLLEQGEWSFDELHWNVGRVVCDLETTQAVSVQVADLRAELLPPWALLWQATADSHPHLLLHNFDFGEAVFSLVQVLWRAMAQEMAVHFRTVLPVLNEGLNSCRRIDATPRWLDLPTTSPTNRRKP